VSTGFRPGVPTRALAGGMIVEQAKRPARLRIRTSDSAVRYAESRASRWHLVHGVSNQAKSPGS
jgi:hypothetical protein